MALSDVTPANLEGLFKKHATDRGIKYEDAHSVMCPVEVCESLKNMPLTRGNDGPALG